MKLRALLLSLSVLGACADSNTDDGGTAGAGSGRDRAVDFTVEELMNPETCKDCHPRHYREWRSSMHAYAADDPVFTAMNKRGQRETNGELGSFCVNCHAPMAVLEGATVDGSELEDEAFPPHLKGVTCYFCHQVVGVEGHQNNGLVIARDNVMRGNIQDPVQPSAHIAEASRYVDGETLEGAQMCGSCHDIVTPSGVELERTFKEWQESVFTQSNTCANCHMPAVRGQVAAEDPDSDVPTRDIHEHLWPAVDVALTPFPGADAQRAAIDCDISNGTRIFSLAVQPDGLFTLQLETNAGHGQPSGASQDRRLWLEFVAYDEDDNIVFSTGVVADDEVVDKPEGHPDYDPYLTVYRDHIYDDSGERTHMFWEAAITDAYPKGYETKVLPFAKPGQLAHSRAAEVQVPGGLPARVTARLRMRPMGRDVLQDLVDSGDLDPSLMDAMPTHELRGTYTEWSLEEDGPDALIEGAQGPGPDCREYRCLLDPESCE